MRDRITRKVASLAAAMLLALSVGARADAPALQKLNVAYAFIASSTLPMWIAQDQGLFKKYGLDVNMILFQGSAAATQALLSGSVDIVFGSASSAITVVGRGAPVAVIATTHLLDYQLVARPNVKTADGLRGGTVGISAYSGGDDFALRRLLPKLGLTLGKDVKFVVLGTPNPAQKVEAVLNGTTDATLATFEVSDALEAQGKRVSVLTSLLANGIKLSVGDVYLMRPYLARNPEIVKDFLRGFVEAIRLAKNDKQLSMDTLRKYIKIDDPGILAEIYQKTVVGQFKEPPYPDVDAILTQRDDTATTSPDLAKLASMPVDAFIDNAPLKALGTEGFYSSLPALRPQP
jgi:NitT/TauT family transport system substrate-binding protein